MKHNCYVCDIEGTFHGENGHRPYGVGGRPICQACALDPAFVPLVREERLRQLRAKVPIALEDAAEIAQNILGSPVASIDGFTEQTPDAIRSGDDEAIEKIAKVIEERTPPAPRKQQFLAALRNRTVQASPEKVNHPPHYGGKDDPFEAIKVIEAWQLDFHLGNVIKYIARAGKKGARLEDLKKARWYLDRCVENLENDG